MLAAIGWCIIWYVEYQERFGRNYYPTPARGWTLDDPDMLANITIIISAMIYLIYNIQVNTNTSSEIHNYFYIYGDIFYFINSIFYTFAAMRECGWFWFMPAWGRWVSIEELQERYLIDSYVTNTNSIHLASRYTSMNTDDLKDEILTNVPIQSDNNVNIHNVIF